MTVQNRQLVSSQASSSKYMSVLDGSASPDLPISPKHRGLQLYSKSQNEWGGVAQGKGKNL